MWLGGDGDATEWFRALLSTFSGSIRLVKGDHFVGEGCQEELLSALHAR